MVYGLDLNSQCSIDSQCSIETIVCKVIQIKRRA